MEHINTQRRPLGLKWTNLSTDQFFSSGADAVFTLAMILFGMAGCIYVLYIQSSSRETLNEHVVLTASVPTAGPEIRTAIATIVSQKEEPEYVQVSGTRKAKAPMYFEIDAYDQAAEYLFDFGNGKLVPAQGQITAHTFGKAGAHNVTLTVSYLNEKKVIDLGAVWVQ